MKNNFFKYIFTVIAIGLIAFAIYYIYNNEMNNSQNVVDEASDEQNEEITNLRLRHF